ncbi:MAG TPA: hypothetical protein PKL97_06375 [Candidatus Omnitrophota bacterium]|nr:hypothetical protein [Candidatus Omnitrophota bacterium]
MEKHGAWCFGGPESPKVSREEIGRAVGLAEFVLQRGLGGDFARSAVCGLCRLGRSVQDPLFHCKLRVLLWTIERMPYAPPVLVGKSLEALEAIAEYFDRENRFFG